MDYLSFLKLLLSASPKLPAIWEQVLRIVAAVKAIGEILRPDETPGVLSVMQVGSAEGEAELLVAAAIAGPNAAFDGTFLRNLYQFLTQHPELFTLLMTLLRKGG